MPRYVDLTYVHSPCLVDKTGNETVRNEYSWNSVANVIFLDQVSKCICHPFHSSSHILEARQCWLQLWQDQDQNFKGICTRCLCFSAIVLGSIPRICIQSIPHHWWILWLVQRLCHHKNGSLMSFIFRWSLSSCSRIRNHCKEQGCWWKWSFDSSLWIYGNWQWMDKS